MTVGWDDSFFFAFACRAYNVVRCSHPQINDEPVHLRPIKLIPYNPQLKQPSPAHRVPVL